MGGQSERDFPRDAVVKNSLLLFLYYGRLESSARSCATRRSIKSEVDDAITRVGWDRRE